MCSRDDLGGDIGSGTLQIRETNEAIPGRTGEADVVSGVAVVLDREEGPGFFRTGDSDGRLLPCGSLILDTVAFQNGRFRAYPGVRQKAVGLESHDPGETGVCRPEPVLPVRPEPGDVVERAIKGAWDRCL